MENTVAEGYDIGRQIVIAERRYADARVMLQRAREEYRVFEGASDARIEVLRMVRARFAAAEVNTRRLLAHLEKLRLMRNGDSHRKALPGDAPQIDEAVGT